MDLLHWESPVTIKAPLISRLRPIPIWNCFGSFTLSPSTLIDSCGFCVVFSSFWSDNYSHPIFLMLLCIISFVADLNLHTLLLVSFLLILPRLILPTNHSTGEWKVFTIWYVFCRLSAAPAFCCWEAWRHSFKSLGFCHVTVGCMPRFEWMLRVVLKAMSHWCQQQGSKECSDIIFRGYRKSILKVELFSQKYQAY